MKLGKALATGVAEERPLVHEEEAQVPEEIVHTGPAEPAEPAESAREEVPAVR
ncbi:MULTISPECIES: hypothetical protein [Streptomyces]|uniref:hypothetical protein n=1 Tax=Streptomyces TaxID=1883 RepID=UPI000ABC2AA9|nr:MULTISPECIES: hypothetical protein [Streptomyces]MCH0558600.1 hypothetical protein [Streptomyces sp. MUM 16J]